MVVGDASIDIDVLVIGGGPGGYVAAIRAAQLGKEVLLVDKDEVGGVCLNRGCIPSKALISAAEQYERAKNGAAVGIEAEGVRLDFAKVQQWKASVVQRLTGGVKTLLKGNNVQLFNGEAMFINEREVRVFNDHESHRYRFQHCIVAVGSRPIELPAFPFGGRILSSTEALALTEVPSSLIVIGGGYIGVELGQAYAKFGTKVTILEGSEAILPGFEQELTRLVAKKLEQAGAAIHTGAKAQSAEQTGDQVTVTFAAGGEEKQVSADYVLVTVGRRPNTDGDFGLELAGVEVDDRGYVRVNERCETNVPNIYAIGDIVPGPALAHKASYEGKVAAEAIAGLPSAVDYKAIPLVVFSDPEIASVGFSETEAKSRGFDVSVGKFPFAANGRALSLNAAEGMVKLVADKASGVLLGAQIAGPGASDLIAELGLAIEMGATAEDIALTIHAHPTLGETVMEAAEAVLGRPIHMLNK